MRIVSQALEVEEAPQLVRQRGRPRRAQARAAAVQRPLQVARQRLEGGGGGRRAALLGGQQGGGAGKPLPVPRRLLARLVPACLRTALHLRHRLRQRPAERGVQRLNRPDRAALRDHGRRSRHRRGRQRLHAADAGGAPALGGRGCRGGGGAAWRRRAAAAGGAAGAQPHGRWSLH
jgi:hypothetical protein